jgi:hypothetical protein
MYFQVVFKKSEEKRKENKNKFLSTKPCYYMYFRVNFKWNQAPHFF